MEEDTVRRKEGEWSLVYPNKNAMHHLLRVERNSDGPNDAGSIYHEDDYFVIELEGKHACLHATAIQPRVLAALLRHIGWRVTEPRG